MSWKLTPLFSSEHFLAHLHIMGCLDISIALSFVFNDWKERFLSNGTLTGVKRHSVSSPQSGIQSHGEICSHRSFKLPYNFQLFSMTCLLSKLTYTFPSAKGRTKEKAYPKTLIWKGEKTFSTCFTVMPSCWRIIHLMSSQEVLLLFCVWPLRRQYFL